MPGDHRQLAPRNYLLEKRLILFDIDGRQCNHRLKIGLAQGGILQDKLLRGIRTVQPDHYQVSISEPIPTKPAY